MVFTDFGGLFAMMAGLIVGFLVVGLILYIYTSLAVMKIAKRNKTENAWMAWVPILNIYLIVKMAKLPGWWFLAVLALFVPFIGGVAFAAAGAYWWWKICESLKKPGWMSLLMLIPIVNLVILGILAWGE